MSSLAPAPPDDDGRLALTPANVRAVLAKPLQVLPPAVRPAAAKVWLCYRHLPGMESGLPVATLLAVWIDEHGLHPDDAVACLDRCTAPDAVGGHRFASDLTATLGTLAGAAIRERRKRDDDRDRRAADAEAARTALPPDEVRSRLKGVTALGLNAVGAERRSG